MSRFLLACFFLYFGYSAVYGQDCQSDRFQQAVFTDVSVSYDVVYSTADAYDVLNQDNPEEYKMDIYQPMGDTQIKRPVVFMFFGGGFINGDKQDADMIAWCDSLARYGYVAVSVNYRLGFNYVDSGSPVRAVYRTIQDANAAIRYMLEFQEDYRIDPNHIYLGGKSAGGILVLHTTFMGDEADRPDETYGTFLEGTDLGCVSCSGNNYQHDFDIKGVMGLWGAIQDTAFITSDEAIPTLMIHGDGDQVVPFDEGYPYTGQFQLTFPYIYGSQRIHQHMNSIGIYNEFYPYEYDDHDVYGSNPFPNENWDEIWNHGHSFYYQTMQFESPKPQGATQADSGITESYSIEMPAPGSVYCWDITGGTIVSEDNSQIEVQWDGGLGILQVTEKNCIGAVGTVSETLEVNAIVNVNNPETDNPTHLIPSVVFQGDNIFILNDNPTETGNYEISFYQVDGKKIKTIITKENTPISSIDLPKGVIFADIGRDGFSMIQKLIIR